MFNKKNIHFKIWDTAGQERFRALRTPFYRGSDVCLLTYAVDDSASFKGLQEWREEFLRYADVSPDTFPFIVVGNKVQYILIMNHFLFAIFIL